MVEKISHEDLTDGFVKQADHMRALIAAAKEQYDSKRYHLSLGFGILALEELTKLREIRNSDDRSGEMDLSEWNKLTGGPGVHVKKLDKPIKEMKQRQEEKNSEYWDPVQEFIDSTLISAGGSKTKRVKPSFDFEMHDALNQLKQACFYMDFKDGKWYSAKLFLTIRELESLAYVQLNMAEFNFNQYQLHNKHREINIDPNSESYQNYVSDSLFKKHVEFQKISKSKTFNIKSILAQSALQKFKRKKNA